MSWQARFGELRSLVHGQPSEAAWTALAALCDTIPTWTPDEQALWHEQGVPYMRGALARWPLALCVAPWWDTRALLRGSPTSQLFPIARALVRPRHEVTTAEAIRMAADPRLAHIESIELRTVKLSAQGAAALVSSPHLTRLTALDLTNNSIGQRTADALVTSGMASRLTSLRLTMCPLGKRGGRALLGRADLSRLTGALELSSCHLGPAGLLALAANPAPPTPAELRIGYNQPRRPTPHRVWPWTIDSPHRPRRAMLDRGGQPWFDACCALVTSPVVSRAATLHLEGVLLDAAHMRALLAHDAPLRHLRLGFVDPAALAALVRDPRAATLEHLSFDMTPEGAHALIDALAGDHLTSLRALNLHCSAELSEPTAQRLLAWPRLAQLTTLSASLDLRRQITALPECPEHLRR
jgi:hypothetical protein